MQRVTETSMLGQKILGIFLLIAFLSCSDQPRKYAEMKNFHKASMAMMQNEFVPSPTVWQLQDRENMKHALYSQHPYEFWVAVDEEGFWLDDDMDERADFIVAFRPDLWFEVVAQWEGKKYFVHFDTRRYEPRVDPINGFRAYSRMRQNLEATMARGVVLPGNRLEMIFKCSRSYDRACAFLPGALSFQKTEVAPPYFDLPVETQSSE